MTAPSAVFTPAEVAARVGASESYIRSLAARREVPHLRVGRKAIRFTAGQVEALIAHLTQEPEQATPSLTTSRSRSRRRA